ncbi:hypothetical protein GW846_02645 [Candidatus Gracilibacteria bacterium]|nr:hypothetical protein [Candidatus Gracilibacteria bacterium]
MSITPAMQQYYDIKNANPDCIIFFRMGDFYELFEEDATLAHKILGITLTSRNKNAENPILLAGFPYHAKEKYLPSFIKAGYKVAIVEQVGNPKEKGIVERRVSRIITPATLALESDDYENLTQQQISVSLVFKDDLFAMSIMNFSEHTWTCSEFDNFDDCANELYKIGPNEVILEKDAINNNKILDILQKKYGLNIFYYYFHDNSYSLLKNKFGVLNLESFGIEKKDLVQKSCAILLKYVSENQQSDLPFLKHLVFKNYSGYMELDESTIRSLDLVYNIATKSSKKGTLLGVLDETKTPMGRRFMREQILRPLQDIDTIKERQSFIAEFKKNQILLDQVRNELKYIADIDAILTRLSIQRAGPRDLISLKKSLIAVRNVTDIIRKSENSLLKKLI